MQPESQNILSSDSSSPLPFEIMSEIFFQCLPLPPDTDIGPDKSQAPLLLGRICSVWRDIALTTPILWASLSIHNTDTAGSALLADLWLSRARGYPLSIHVDDQEEGETVITPNREMFFQTICRYSLQWRDVALSVPLSALPLLQLEGPLPQLERLVIGSSVSVAPIQSITVFDDAPLLREVHLTLDDMGSVQPWTIVLPWEQLTSFTGRLLSFDECLYILRDASSLIEGNFYDCIGGRPGVDMLPPLPLITKLRLEGNVPDTLTNILQCLTLPSLEFLELRTPQGYAAPENFMVNSIALGGLLSFLSRSSCPLREFRLTASWTLPERLFQCLSAMPALEVLHMTWFSNSEFSTEILKRLHSSFNLLPRLRSLSVHYTTVAGVPYNNNGVDAIIAMLFSRSKDSADDSGGMARLERFSLSWLSFHVARSNDGILDRFKVLVGRGMQIHLGPRDASWI
ncbi:hypothetical protein FB451DRAFT_1222156 [Mycena latifolia]|nr:hypothetical protein FB451DRAFT_1222156 [Mycena latifolia]